MPNIILSIHKRHAERAHILDVGYNNSMGYIWRCDKTICDELVTKWARINNRRWSDE